MGSRSSALAVARPASWPASHSLRIVRTMGLQHLYLDPATTPLPSGGIERMEQSIIDKHEFVPTDVFIILMTAGALSWIVLVSNMHEGILFHDTRRYNDGGIRHYEHNVRYSQFSTHEADISDMVPFDDEVVDDVLMSLPTAAAMVPSVTADNPV